MKSNLLTVAVATFTSILLLSCQKMAGDNDLTCEKIKSAKITVPKTTFFAGEEIRLSTVEGANIFYGWNHSVLPGNLGSSSSYIIPACSKADEGWFYLSVGNPDCTTKHDSVYITVINKPIAAPCSPVNNKVDFSSVPDISFSSATWSYEVGYNSRNLRGYQGLGYPDINVFFHHYWNDMEPEDGEYSLNNVPSFDGGSVYSVYLASHYDITWYGGRNGKVYVSHVNGKIQVTFCNVTFSAEGNSFTGTGKLTAQ
jgi:hypothetical protein